VPFPKQREIEIPLLQVLERRGGEATPREVYAKVAGSFPDLTQEEQEERMESYPSTRKWWNTVQWVRQKLVEKGEIDGSVRGVWRITQAGRDRLGNRAQKVKESQPETGEGIVEHADTLTLRELVDESAEAAKRRIITELKALEPNEFENFCRIFLEALGFDNVQVTGRAGDGGVDGFGDFRQGVVRIKSAFQSKRFTDAAVGRPEIDKFRGAIQGEYDHGVFLTTSRFSREAQGAAVRKGAITLLLLDGASIADIMIERGIGVRKRPIYLVDVDESFFPAKSGE